MSHNQNQEPSLAWAALIPGAEDVGILRVNEPVPSNIAVSIRVMSHLFDHEAQISAFLRRQRFEAIGFSTAQPTRQKVAISYGEYPFRGDLVMLRAAGEGGATNVGGDSGSSLFLLRRQPNGRMSVMWWAFVKA